MTEVPDRRWLIIRRPRLGSEQPGHRRVRVERARVSAHGDVRRVPAERILVDAHPELHGPRRNGAELIGHRPPLGRPWVLDQLPADRVVHADGDRQHDGVEVVARAQRDPRRRRACATSATRSRQDRIPLCPATARDAARRASTADHRRRRAARTLSTPSASVACRPRSTVSTRPAVGAQSEAVHAVEESEDDTACAQRVVERREHHFAHARVIFQKTAPR